MLTYPQWRRHREALRWVLIGLLGGLSVLGGWWVGQWLHALGMRIGGAV